MQDLEGDLGLVLGVDGEFADGAAEVCEWLCRRLTKDREQAPSRHELLSPYRDLQVQG